MCSRTVTLNIRSPFAVADGVAERRLTPGREPRHQGWQLVERRHASDQRIEGGIAQQVKRESSPVDQGPAAGPGGGDRTHLAGTDGEPRGVEGAPERELNLRIAVPGQVDDGALSGQQVQ